MLQKIITSFMFWVGCTIMLQAQTPFICDGTFYTSFIPENDIYSRIFQVDFDPLTSEVLFTDLSGSLGIELNAIGYRVTDNLIYGVDPYSHVLYQIDANGVVVNLGTLNLNPNALYFAGDITPDGQSLALLGTAGGFAGTVYELSLVNLDDYSVKTLPLTITDMFVTDVAFNPFNGQLYAVDTDKRRIATVDVQTGAVQILINNISLDVQTLASLFFDSFGNLYGYGDTGFVDGFFSINLQSGNIVLEEPGIGVTYNDGCSCPYTVEILQKINTENAVICEEVIVTMIVSNATGQTRGGISISESFPTGFIIQDILYNPYTGNITSGIGTNTLSMENLSIPLGVDSIQLLIGFTAATIDGNYSLQADLNGLPAALGTTAISDNPETSVKDDPNILEVKQQIEVNAFNTQSICFAQNEVATLDASSYDGTFLWENGSTNPIRIISDEGLYQLVINEDCLETTLDFQIDPIPLNTNFESFAITLCNNQDSVISASLDNVEYGWNTGSTLQNITINSDGIYIVDMLDDCLEWQEEFIVETQDLKILSAVNLFDVEKGESLTIDLDIFNPQSFNYTISWTGPDLTALSCTNCLSQTINTYESGWYTATIINEDGCSDSYEFYINILPLKVKIFWPNVFSPNGDGINDLFYPFSDITTGQILNFEIFDRWGAHVFSNNDQLVNDPSAGWNGKFKGDYVHPAVYAFYAEIQFFDEVRLYEGSISVIR